MMGLCCRCSCNRIGRRPRCLRGMQWNDAPELRDQIQADEVNRSRKSWRMAQKGEAGTSFFENQVQGFVLCLSGLRIWLSGSGHCEGAVSIPSLVQWLKGPGIAAAEAPNQSLALELPYAMDTTIKKKYWLKTRKLPGGLGMRNHHNDHCSLSLISGLRRHSTRRGL